jgi:thioesterase domain-containing protein
VPQPYAGRVTLFRTKGGPYVPPFDWEQLTSGQLEVLFGPGEHSDLRSEPYVRQWAEQLKKSLQQVQEPTVTCA